MFRILRRYTSEMKGGFFKLLSIFFYLYQRLQSEGLHFEFRIICSPKILGTIRLEVKKLGLF